MEDQPTARPTGTARLIGGLAVVVVLILVIAALMLYRALSAPSYSSPPKVCGGHGCVLNQPRPLAPTGPNPVRYPLPASPTGTVDWAYMPLPDNQGGVGQCQCYAFRKQFARLYNQANHTWRKFSCRFWYSLVDQGKDQGSYFGQYVAALNTVGGVFHKQYDYAGYPTPGQLQYPLPSDVMALAPIHRYAVKEVVLGAGSGEGSQASTDVEYWLSQGYPVNLDVSVFSGASGFFNSTGIIDLPNTQGGDAYYGGHAITIIEYDRNLTINGVTGWFKFENNWGRQWGRDCHTGQVNPGRNGCGYISYRYVQQYGWGLEVIQLTQARPQLSAPPPWHQPGPLLDKPLPPPKNTPKHFPPTIAPQGSAYVSHVYARDLCSDGTWQFTCRRYLDAAPIINAAARYYGVYPPGLLAVLGAECGLYTHSFRCDRYGGWPDVSFGSCQVTVSTAAGYGVGGGTSYWTNYVRDYENHAANCIWLAAKVFGSFQDHLRQVGCSISWPNLYVPWNAGDNLPCWFYANPTGQAAVNLYGNFNGWWRWALQYAVTYDPYAPKPKPFPRIRWGSVNPYWHGHLSWAASVWLRHQRLGKALSVGSWHPGRPGYDHYPFVRGHINCWPKTHRCTVRVDP